MLSVELKVNGTLIGNINITNKGTNGDLSLLEEDKLYYYSFSYDGKKNDEVKGQVLHCRKDGALALVAEVVRKIIEKTRS